MPWQLCGLEQVTQPLCASASPSVIAATRVAPVGLNKPINTLQRAGIQKRGDYYY